MSTHHANMPYDGKYPFAAKSRFSLSYRNYILWI